MGGIDVREFDPLELRRQFGVVLQDPYLFTGTLEENIRLGTDAHSARRKWQAAAEQVNLLDFIRRCRRASASPIRERGSGAFHRAEAAHQLRPRAGAQPALPDPGRGHLERGHGDGVPRARGAQPHGGGAHLDRHRAPAFDDPARRPHPGDAQGHGCGKRGTHQELLAQRGIYWKLYQLQYKDQEITPYPASEDKRTNSGPNDPRKSCS